MDKESDHDDSGEQSVRDENKYQDEEARNTAIDTKDEENSKSKNESTHGSEHENNEQVGVKDTSNKKRSLSFLPLFTRKSKDKENEESESEESEDETKSGQGSSDEAKREKPPKKKKKSSLLSFFSLKPDVVETKQSDSLEEGDEVRSDEEADRRKIERSDDEKEEKPKVLRRPSFIKKKFLALEMELDVENVYKKDTSVFSLDQDKPSEEDTNVSKDEQRTVYLSSAMAAMFIVSSSTGGAISGLAFFLMQSSWFGVFLIMLLGFNGIYAGLCTGWSWTIMEKIWPEYSEYSRIPYQEIAYRAVGTWMKYIVAIFVDVTLLVSCACYIVFMADSIAKATSNDYIICPTMIIIILILTPLSFFRSFSHMKFVGLIDVSVSISYTVLIIICLFMDKSSRGPAVYSDPKASSIVIAFAGMSFAYGIGAVMPSIMVEMADRSMFTSTCVTAYMVIVAIYVVFPIIGYAAYGDETPTSILHHVYMSKKLHYFAVFIDCLNVVQLGSTFLCAMMPTMLAFEDRLNCPHRFSAFRVVIRLTLMLFILLLVLGVPYVPRFLVFIGATSMNILTFILPPVFYVCLVYKKKSKSSKSEMNKRAWILIVEIVLLGLIVGAISMYVSVIHYIDSPIYPRNCFSNISARLPNEQERGS